MDSLLEYMRQLDLEVRAAVAQPVERVQGGVVRHEVQQDHVGALLDFKFLRGLNGRLWKFIMRYDKLLKFISLIYELFTKQATLYRSEE